MDYLTLLGAYNPLHNLYCQLFALLTYSTSHCCNQNHNAPLL
nr:MAG TPA: hypothetical protein [Caudoviricetes sp.]